MHTYIYKILKLQALGQYLQFLLIVWFPKDWWCRCNTNCCIVTDDDDDEDSGSDIEFQMKKKGKCESIEYKVFSSSSVILLNICSTIWPFCMYRWSHKMCIGDT